MARTLIYYLDWSSLEGISYLLGHSHTQLTNSSFQDNCGSVTPGVLRSLIPFGSNIRTFTLGLSYSLTHQDVFDFLEKLPNLRELDLQYYLVCISLFIICAYADAL